jgi:hypothetical protein
MMSTLLSTPEIATTETMTERCDSCGAAARMELTLTNGGTLAFCGHHSNKLAGGLVKIAAKVTLEVGFEWAGKVPAQ